MDTAKNTPTIINISDFAEFVIQYFDSIKQAPTSNLMLQKVLYYIQAYHLVYFNKHPLFNDQPEAWVRGPVYKRIYNVYKDFGADEIILSGSKSKGEKYQEKLSKLNFTEEQNKFILFSLDYFSNKTPTELIMRSHREKPWNEARKGVGDLEYSNEVITHNMMYEYYYNVINSKEKSK